MKRLFERKIHVALLAIVLIFVSCKEEAERLHLIESLSVKIEYPSADFIDTRYANKEVCITGENNYTVTTDSNGYANFTDVMPGVYNLSISTTLAKDEYDNLVVPTAETILINGVLSNIKLYESIEDSIALTMGVVKELVISKIYNSQSKDDNNKNYLVDSYVEIYNNTDADVNIENLYLALCETESSIPFVDYRNDNVYARDVFNIPDTILGAGQAIVLARQAKDHTEDASMSVNLSGADYENKAAKNQIYNDLIPKLPHAYQSLAALDYMNLGPTLKNNSILLFKYDGDINEFEKIDKNFETKKTLYLVIPISQVDILDGVEVLPYDSEMIKVEAKRMADGIDATYITLSTKSGRNGESLDRKVASWDGDRAILQDSNNSLEDFTPTGNPASRDYTKPELQP